VAGSCLSRSKTSSASRRRLLLAEVSWASSCTKALASIAFRAENREAGAAGSLEMLWLRGGSCGGVAGRCLACAVAALPAKPLRRYSDVCVRCAI
jgi:hypothetical protein